MRGLTQGEIADHFEFETFEGRNLGGMICQQQNATQTQVVKNLRPYSVIAIDSVTGFQTRLPFAQAAFLHQSISAELIYKIQAMFALA